MSSIHAHVFEVHSFVDKFLALCNNGESANLTLKCHDDGKIVIDLQLHLPAIPPPSYHPYASPRARPSPSRLRRSARRAQYRAENNASKTQTEQVSVDCTQTKDQTIIPAEEAAKDATDNTEDVVTIHQGDQLPAEQAVDCVPAEQAAPPRPQTSHYEQEQIFTSKQDTISSNQQFILICNFCKSEFANEEELKDHTCLEHSSGRIRFERKIKKFSS